MTLRLVTQIETGTTTGRTRHKFDTVAEKLNLCVDSALNQIATDIVLFTCVADTFEEAVGWAEGHYGYFGRQVVEICWED